MTRDQLKKTIQRAELTASLLHLAHAPFPVPMRRQLVADLRLLAEAARLVVHRVPEREYDQTAESDASESDLLGGAA